MVGDSNRSLSAWVLLVVLASLAQSVSRCDRNTFRNLLRRFTSLVMTLSRVSAFKIVLCRAKSATAASAIQLAYQDNRYMVGLHCSDFSVSGTPDMLEVLWVF